MAAASRPRAGISFPVMQREKERSLERRDVAVLIEEIGAD